jgi:hypothetical protein
MGATGSVYLFARHSSTEKDTAPSSVFVDNVSNDSSLDSLLYGIVQSSTGSTDISGGMKMYMSGVNAQKVSTRKNKILNVLRFTPPFSFNSNTVRKLLVKNTLNQYYRNAHPTAQWATTNYYSLNIFTGSSVPTGVALLYPDDRSIKNGSRAVGGYVLPMSWSFDFYINPKYTTDFPVPQANFKASTICHLSSCYAVSLITGSSTDLNGYPNAYRLMLQLSHSAETVPSKALPGSAYTSSLVFLSDDNVLRRNNWHHVVIRWGTSQINFGTGSFVIDGTERGTFAIPSASIMPPNFSGTLKSNPDVLVIGNFYEGSNTGTNSISQFFGTDPAARDGLRQLENTIGQDAPNSYVFNHQLNAEVHDLAIKKYYMSNNDILVSASRGPLALGQHAFFLPPYFTTISPSRSFVGTYGGVPQTPFFTVNGSTKTPFNTDFSFGIGGHYLNLENFTQDFATKNFPKLLNLTASTVQTTTPSALTANTYLYMQPATAMRNLTVLPCDDGNYLPNYDLISSQVGLDARFTDDLGTPDYSLINLDNLVSTASIMPAITDESGSLFQQLAGASPEQLGTAPASALAILQRTKDPSSNEVVFFDISNLFYGNKIHPGTFQITDANVSGSSNKVSITLQDDGHGNIYRADCLTSASSWNSVGNIYYNEGIVAIKTPNIPFFGQDQFSVSFSGEQNVHVMRVDVLANATQLNSSSNPAYNPNALATAYPNDPDRKFVYITGINIHDENFNVITKTVLAQPIVKRQGDRFLFKVKIDF